MASEITVKVKLSKWLAFRLNVTMALIWVAGWVLGCQVEVNVTDNKKAP